MKIKFKELTGESKELTGENPGRQWKAIGYAVLRELTDKVQWWCLTPRFNFRMLEDESREYESAFQDWLEND